VTVATNPDATRQRVDYQHRKENGLCVDCGSDLQEDDGLNCCDCAERQKVYKARWARTPRGRRLSRIKEAKRYARPEVAEAKKRKMRERYMALKLAGLCVRCGVEPQRETNIECARCYSGEPRRILKRRPSLTSLTVAEPTWTDRVIVALRFLDWASVSDVADALGLEGGVTTERNSVQAAIARIAKRGLAERRSVGWRAEYRLLPAGKTAADELRKRTA